MIKSKKRSEGLIPTLDRSADAHIRAARRIENLADVGIRAPMGRLLGGITVRPRKIRFSSRRVPHC